MAHVLIVDDNAQFRGLVRLMLEDLGYTSAEAGNGPEALAALAQGGFDVALVDMFMPGMDGLELTKQIRKKDPHLPILATSGGGNMRMTNLLDWARDLGATLTIAKPFEAAQLGRMLKVVLARRRASVA
jgi:CheY-like chemotaxis protein